MLELIESTLRSYTTISGDYSYRYRLYNYDEVAEFILENIEDSGMLPPYVPSAGTGDFDECTRDHVGDCAWDKEED